MTALRGIHHLGLTVTNVERSARWYQDVLGFREVGRLGGASDTHCKIYLRHEGFGVRLGLVSHRGAGWFRFDETMPGLDHLSFAVADRGELERWCRRLFERGVAYSPIAEARSIPGAAVVVFRDPDNIQLELFADA
jgi:catechol 2,3-dioxygenase-like lactoylglutathione lyase family enzyme